MLAVDNVYNWNDLLSVSWIQTFHQNSSCMKIVDHRVTSTIIFNLQLISMCIFYIFVSINFLFSNFASLFLS